MNVEQFYISNENAIRGDGELVFMFAYIYA